MPTIDALRASALLDVSKMRLLHAIARGGVHVIDVERNVDDVLVVRELHDAELVVASDHVIDGRAAVFVVPTPTGWVMARHDASPAGAPARMVRRRAEKRGDTRAVEIETLLEKASEPEAELAPAERLRLQGLGMMDREGKLAPAATELGELVRHARGSSEQPRPRPDA